MQEFRDNTKKGTEKDFAYVGGNYMQQVNLKMETGNSYETLVVLYETTVVKDIALRIFVIS